VLECVVNVSEGTDRAVVDELARSAGATVLDVHSDADHNRSVLTLAGPDLEAAVQALARRTVELIDLRHHHGVHPRLGALDVVPFVPLPDETGTAPTMADALAARDRFASWAADELGLPCFTYGPERTLPEVRRRAFVDLAPDTGPAAPHPTAGACAVGARGVLVAYNLWLDTTDVSSARTVAAAVRGPHLRALGLATGGVTQVSCNLVDPTVLGPAAAYDAVAAAAAPMHIAVTRAELVGLVPRSLVLAVPEARRAQLDLDLERTIEARLAARAG
jgi:glutamate formiminotransferase